MLHSTLDILARGVVVAALLYASIVALTHWAVRRRKIGPFGPWPRIVRRVSDPVLLPLERRVIRFGGSPQDAPLWLLGIVILGGLLLLSLMNWLLGMAGTVTALATASPRDWLRILVGWAFSLVMASIFIRVIVSWFGVSEYRPWMRPLVFMTDWIIRPIRRILPPAGMIDFSPMVAWLVLWVARGVVLGIL
ncbi:MAG TPA: YggT family protein [Gemmatimonadales bacterium]|jgi:YggT family protein|nr:YggT family protein [Gemmatimonadales bacterium]